MKKRLHFLFTCVIACSCAISISAQNDVSSDLLQNPGFNLNVNHSATETSVNVAVDAPAPGTFETVTGWTVVPSFIGNSASSTFAFGSPSKVNNTLPPTVDKDGNNLGGVLGFSVAWTGFVTYYQNVYLPEGVYSIEATAYNNGPNALAHSRVGWVPESGAPVISTKTSYPLATWGAETVNFTVTGSARGKIQIGVASTNAGSGAHGRIFFDNIKLICTSFVNTVDAKITEATSLLGSDTGADAVTLNNVIAQAQIVANAGVSATLKDVSDALTALENAMTVYKIAVASPTNQVNITSYIKNASFEHFQLDKQQTIPYWTKTGAANSEYCTRNDAGPASFKTGNVYFQYLNSAKPDFSISQTISGLPNGKYRLTAAAGGDAGTTGTYVYAGDNQTHVTSTGDHSVDAVVLNGTLTIGFKSVSRTVSWAFADNFRLYYLGEVLEPVISVSATSFFFDSDNLSKTFTLTGVNLTADVSLVSSVAGVTVLPATISKDDAELATGKTVTVTFDPAATGAGSLTGTITVSTAGVDDKVIAVATSKDSECFTPLYNDRTNLVADPYCNDRSKFGGWGNVEVSNTTALCGLRSLKVFGGSLDVSVAGGAAIASNKTYRVKTNIFVPAGHTAKFGLFRIGNSGDVNIYNSMVNDAWETVDFTFKTATVGAGGVFFQRATGADGVYVDNYEMYEVAEPTIRIKYVDADNETITLKDDRVHTSTWGATVANYLMIGKTFTAPASDKEDITFGSNEYNYEATSVDNVTVNEGENVVVLKFKKNLSTSLDNGVNTAISVYPTVASGKVTVDMKSQNGVVRVFDATGKMIHSRNISGSVENFEVSGNGLYMFEIRTDKSTEMVKVINLK
ncbi:MAG: T9SS type A sorting domain-containing protein [Paludibacter sp.]|nr:T9SS type A sorting domain-containing protein [Paludibacter sp.]